MSLVGQIGDDPIPNIIYSLPAVAHSLAITNRTPTAGFTQKFKYMPDYGGILEIPNSSLKNNGLAPSQLPLSANLTTFNEIALNRNHQYLKSNEPTNDCLVVLPINNRTILAISAIENQLYLDYVERDLTDRSYSSSPIALEKYNELITGLKLSGDCLLVKFSQTQKVVKLNQLLLDGPENASTILPEKHLQSLHSITEIPGMAIRDCCLNRFNKSILGIASDHFSLGQLKLYDISESRHPFHTITWDSLVDSSYVEENELGRDTVVDINLRRRSIRTFRPTKPALRGIQQLDNIPSHLVNMFVSTDYKTSLIDPRIDRIAQVYVDRSEIPTFYPTEYLRRSIFSQRNGYQFYSLTNHHIRVFDTRYLGLPLNQINHMLDSDSYNRLHMRLIEYKTYDDKDTLCCSTGNRIAFISFDQTTKSNLINPRSIHLPYHDDFDYILKKELSSLDLNDQSCRMFGLDVWEQDKCDPNEDYNQLMFSVMQISNAGNILIRDYNSKHDKGFNSSVETDEPADFIISQTRNKFHNSKLDCDNLDIKGREVDELIERDVIEGGVTSNLENLYINILDSSSLVAIEDSFSSSRARERYSKMKDNLHRL